MLLDEFRPPSGFRLDRAIGTTYSLDLISLLAAALSMVFYQAENREDVFENPIQGVEAVQRVKDKLVIFCQKARISVPAASSYLFSFLEDLVVEAEPKLGKGVFHPKIWVLRFENDESEIIYRFICLSRNLTYDRSWDAIVTLEGPLRQDRKMGFGQNRPLSNFLEYLPELASQQVNDDQKKLIEKIGSEIRRVEFEPPRPFEGKIKFMPSGIKGYRKIDFDNNSRTLVMSPFISPKVLEKIGGKRNNILISRGGSLDKIKEDEIKNLKKRFEIYQVDEDIGDEEEREEEILSGLHAKVYIQEKGFDAEVAIGSSNATSPAFRGDNIEFMVGFVGKKSKVGINKLMADERGSYREFLRPYTEAGIVSEEERVQKELEMLLEETRDAITKGKPNLDLKEHSSEKLWDLIIFFKENVSISEDVGVEVYPVSLEKGNARKVRGSEKEEKIVFPKLELDQITGFFAFKLSSKKKGQSVSIGFVLNLPLPKKLVGRDRKILSKLVSDQDKFYRFLLLLLADEEKFFFGKMVGKRRWGNKRQAEEIETLPLLEEMVRAFSRSPERLKRINALITELHSTEEKEGIFPEGFLEFWAAFREGLEGESK